MKLQWATYKDAADQCSLSRIWGGIHPYIDDIPGRKIGTEIGFDAFEYGKSLFEEINMITKSYKNNLNNLKVYPNPITANNYMTIVNETDKKIKKISLINFLGKTVFDQNVNMDSKKNRLNINKLPHGIYLLRIMFSDDTMKTTKIVISR